MNTNNHNPNIVPGYYNPQQSKTEALDYQAFLGEGFVDPTQIAMIPGDTQRPIVENRTQSSLDSRAMPPIGASTQNYQREMQAIYEQRELEARNTSNKAIETIRIPIVLELTINLNFNHVSNSNP